LNFGRRNRPKLCTECSSISHGGAYCDDCLEWVCSIPCQKKHNLKPTKEERNKIESLRAYMNARGLYIVSEVWLKKMSKALDLIVDNASKHARECEFDQIANHEEGCTYED